MFIIKRLKRKMVDGWVEKKEMVYIKLFCFRYLGYLAQLSFVFNQFTVDLNVPIYFFKKAFKMDND